MSPRRPCPDCGDLYVRSALKRHRADVHHIERSSFPCSVCQRSFSRNDALEDHLANKHGRYNPRTEAQDRINLVKVRRHTKPVLLEGIRSARSELADVRAQCRQLGAHPIGHSGPPTPIILDYVDDNKRTDLAVMLVALRREADRWQKALRRHLGDHRQQ